MIESAPSIPLQYASSETQSRFDARAFLIRIGPFLGLITIFAFFSVFRYRTFCTANNVEVMLIQTAVVGTAALGMTLIIISGGIDLSVGSTIALCTVSIGLLLERNVSPLLAAIGGVATGTLCGLVIGLLITQLKLPPFIATLSTWGAFRGLAKYLAGETMVWSQPTWLNDILRTLRPGEGWMLFPPGVWVTLVLAVLTALSLRYTRFGRHVFAIGSNEQTARLCGVHVNKTKIMLYMVGASLAGVAGVLQFSYLTLGDPTTAAGMELDIIAAVVIGGASLNGGRGTVLGTLIGALIMTVVSNGCTKMGLANSVQEIVTAGVIVLAVTIDQLRRRAG